MSARLVRLAGIGLALVLFVAAWPKVIHPAAFAASIENYHILPVGLVNLAAISVPFVELVFAALLITGRRLLAAGLGTLMMMAVFLTVLVLARVRGLNIACGCFGTGGGVIGWSEVARDAFLVAIALLVYVGARQMSRKNTRFDAASLRSRQPDGTVGGAK